MVNNLQQILQKHEIEVQKAKDSTNGCRERTKKKFEELTQLFDLPQDSEESEEKCDLTEKSS